MKKETFSKIVRAIAKIIRAVTVPPIMVSGLLISLFATNRDIFQEKSILNLVLAILFLALIPIAAYPLQPLIPKYKDKGREGQRDLAFLLTPVGYVGAVLYGIIVPISPDLMLIFLSYLLSVLALLFFNKVIKFRSSGHMCSVTGPLILISHFIGGTIIPSCILFALVCWSSLLLKRHTLYEVIGGCACCLVSFACSLGIVALVF